MPYITLQLAISILIMRACPNWCRTKLFESARIDGAGHWRALCKSACQWCGNDWS